MDEPEKVDHTNLTREKFSRQLRPEPRVGKAQSKNVGRGSWRKLGVQLE